MSHDHLLAQLGNVGITGPLSHRESLTSSVTSEWGVDWDDDIVARDLMQNFFDANRDRITEVKVEWNSRDVVVRAPTTYNLERLFYLGSEKGAEDVGQYGEGFKAAAVCLLRKFPQAVLLAASGPQVLWIRVDESPVTGTELYPLIYDFFDIRDPIDGNILLIHNTSGDFGKAMSLGLTNFHYEGNPLIGPVVAQDYDGRFSVHTTPTPDGHIFYRKLKRGDIPGISICLVVSKEYREIEKKIRSDRDRKAFGEELRNSFYKLCARYFFDRNQKAQKVVIEAAARLWQKGEGHPLLSEIASHHTAYWLNWNATMSRDIFGDGYFARTHAREANVILRNQELEREWLAAGRIALPGYFKSFGVISADGYYADLEKKARDEARKQEHRLPSLAETAAIRLLSEVVRSLAPSIMAMFDNRRTSYSIAETEVVLGELKKSRSYGAREVFLSAAVFAGDFAFALSVFIHEHAHIFGHDGSRGFTDALTELIETVVRSRSSLDEPERRWNEACEKVRQERSAESPSHVVPRRELDELGETELRALLYRIPSAYLGKLLSDNGKS